MLDLYLVRHGNTFDKGETVTRVGARTDLPLSKSGEAQALELADHFASKCPDGFAAAYCSELKRTRQTAEAILKKSNSYNALKALKFLNEIDYGPDENQPEPEVTARLGQPALDAWETDAIVPSGWRIDPETVRQNWVSFLSQSGHKPTTNVGLSGNKLPTLVVTSNGIARFALLAGKAETQHLPNLKLRTGAYAHLKVAEGGLVDIIDWDVRP